MQNLTKLLTLTCIILTTSNASARWAPKHQCLTCEDKKVLTPISEDNLMSVLHDGYLNLFNKEPFDNVLILGWAHVALENTRGAIVKNKNLGNLAPTFHMNQRWYLHSRLAIYRSFDTFQNASVAYWTVINSCWPAMNAFKEGFPVIASHALKMCNYYGASEESYSNLLTTLFWLAKYKILPRYREQKQKEKLAKDYEINHQYTPACGCSSDFY